MLLMELFKELNDVLEENPATIEKEEITNRFDNLFESSSQFIVPFLKDFVNEHKK